MLKPVQPSILCAVCKRGYVIRIDGSRLEAFLGHAVYRCGQCGQRYKLTPEMAAAGLDGPRQSEK